MQATLKLMEDSLIHKRTWSVRRRAQRLDRVIVHLRSGGVAPFLAQLNETGNNIDSTSFLHTDHLSASLAKVGGRTLIQNM